MHVYGIIGLDGGDPEIWKKSKGEKPESESLLEQQGILVCVCVKAHREGRE